ncbi:MAG: hypothetical protein KG012_09385 [Deltaproteobacteria bacterium]|nr:hypothetical protein [Deltaproteobacteria bacterium]
MRYQTWNWILALILKKELSKIRERRKIGGGDPSVTPVGDYKSLLARLKRGGGGNWL